MAIQKPDGLTLYPASTSHTVTPSLYKSLPYDPIKSFEPISLISSSPFLALVGFNLLPPHVPGALNEFVDLMVPELQRRGLFSHRI